MPEFKKDEAAREKKKLEELAPYLAKAMERKKFMKPLADDEIPDIVALGRQIAESGEGANSEMAKRWKERMAARPEMQKG